MKEKDLNIAIFSPSQSPYSETFIQAHKKYLRGKVFYYFGSGESMQLEEFGLLASKTQRWWLKIISKVLNKPASYAWTKSFLKSLKKQHIDVVLVEYGTHAHRLLEALKQSRIPFVVHFHGYDASVKEVVERHNNYHEVFKYASKIVAVSRKMESMLVNIGCKREKIAHTSCGPNDYFFNIEPQFLKKQFLALGRFVDKKAPYYTVLAFKEVLKKHSDAMLIMAGDGVLLNSVVNLVKHYKLDDNIKFLGVVKPKEYRSLLQESLAFVQHSITAENGDMEGTPVAIVEANLAGLPVISTYHAGIPDVVTHNKTGLLCEEHDVEMMSKYMLQLIDDIDFAKQLGQAGKKHIKQNFSMRHHIDKLQEILITASKKSII
ncbi:glycosyltransferase [Olleya sp. AH-315-F22]|nr:glycosyltransferase [Olleya sp. AH-315-F22]